MTYLYHVIREKPKTALQFGLETVDISGNATRLTFLGDRSLVQSLVAGGSKALVVDSSNVLNIENKAKGRVFSLELWFKNIERDGFVQLLGQRNAQDGVSYDGEQIRFLVKFNDGSSVECLYAPPEYDSSFHIVAACSKTAATLYVDGQPRATQDFTDEQRLSGVAWSQDLACGLGTIKAVVDSVCVYKRELLFSEVTSHFVAGRGVNDVKDTVLFNNSNLWNLVDEEAELLLDRVLPWAEGYAMDVTVSDNLTPTFEDQSSLLGTWTYSSPLVSFADVIDGSKLEWDADGIFEVETSLDDGLSWQKAVNFQEVPGLGRGFQSEQKNLMIRILIPPGLPETTQTLIRALALKLYESKSLSSYDQRRTVEPVGRVELCSQVFQPIEQQDLMGANLINGYLEVSQDKEPEDSKPVRTVELWVKANNSSPSYLVDGSVCSLFFNGEQWSANQAAVYVDGALVNPDFMSLEQNQWHHLVFVSSVNINGKITIGAAGNGSDRGQYNIGMLNLYERSVSAQEVSSIYNYYLGNTQTKITDSSVMRVSEYTKDGPSTNVYAFDWSISSVN